MIFRLLPQLPLVVAANRDERYDRAASPLGVRSYQPRILAGRDEQAGGTWLAVNEHGVVAGLTNQPASGGKDLTKRSRGELPILLTGYDSARSATEGLVRRVEPSEYNSCCLLVGDRDSLFSIEVSSAGTLAVAELGPGRHVLENSPIGARTAKTEFTMRQLDQIGDLGEDALREQLAKLLADHSIPDSLLLDEGQEMRIRPPEATSACVHTEGYGTRSSMIVVVPQTLGSRPRVQVADGPPCVTPFRDAAQLWE